jgi:phosphoribosylanthranilate isomerase
MERVRIKICGITRTEDAINAAAAGVDAIGLVFFTGSPRYVTTAIARTIVECLPPLVCKVGLFVDADAGTVTKIITQVPLDLLQFHGREMPDHCRSFGKPYIKAIPITNNTDIHDFEKRYHDAAGLLLDTHIPGIAGGTGKVFNWGLIPAGLRKPIILAGGLNPGNVGDAIRAARPYAVDVSGGVESSPGIKDRDKMVAFVHAVTSLSRSPSKRSGQNG